MIAAGDRFPLFVVVPPGLEEPAALEVRALAGAATAVAGGVETEGTLAAVVRLNLAARIASRILLRLADGPARELGRLAAGIDWASFLAPGARFELDVAGAGAGPGPFLRTLERAIAGAVPGAAPGPGGAAVHVRVHDGRVTVSVDATGEHLHRRGYRKETGVAPLRENLAAGILALAGYTGFEPLVDPMCGSGTFVIEGALRALDRAPGIARAFACEAWPCLPADLAAAERERARRAERPQPAAPILGSDKNAGALGVARRNATAAGVFPHLALARRDVSELSPPPGAPPGIVVANPPYGRRVGETGDLPALYRTLGARLRAGFHGWTAAILVADRRLEPLLALPSPRVHALRNGGLPCRLLVAKLPQAVDDPRGRPQDARPWRTRPSIRTPPRPPAPASTACPTRPTRPTWSSSRCRGRRPPPTAAAPPTARRRSSPRRSRWTSSTSRPGSPTRRASPCSPRSRGSGS